jgi:hypothetical protein
MFFDDNSSVRITRFFIHETGTYGAQFSRPFEAHFTHDAVNQIAERIEQNQDLSSMAVSGLANQILAPAIAVDQKDIIPIPEGWNEPRFRFMMEVETDNLRGSKITELVMGYSASRDITLQQTINPDLEFYINSTTLIREEMVRVHGVTQPRSVIANSSQLLANNSYANVIDTNNQVMMRPTDLLAQMQTTHLPDDEGDVIDGRTMSTAAPRKSRYGNANSAVYTSRILSSYRDAQSLMALGKTGGSIFSDARNGDQVAEAAVMNDTFLKSLASIQGVASTNYFTLRDLERLSPGYEDVTEAIIMPNLERNRLHHAGDTSPWDGRDRITQVACILSQSIPGIMMESGLTWAAFKATNRTMNSQVAFQPMGLRSFSNMDLTYPAENLRIRTICEVLNDICYQGEIGFAIEMTLDLMGDTIIDIELDGYPTERFVAPSFSNSLATPVFAYNNQHVRATAERFENFINEVLPTISLPQDFAGSGYESGRQFSGY